MSETEVPTPEVGIECSHTRMADVAELVENPRNPNKHPASQIELLAKIIENQGWRSPIVVSKRSGFIVKGHGRFEAALKLGLDQVPIDEQEYESEAKEWADMIADNRLSELGLMERTELKNLIQDLDTGEFDLELTGYMEDDLASMMSEYFDADYSILDEDGVDEKLGSLSSGVKKGIVIEFTPEDFDHATEVVKAARGKGIYIGEILVQALSGANE